MTVELYRDRRGGHRWRIRARNRKILADSGEAYTSRPRMLRTLGRIFLAARKGDITFVDV